MKFPYVSDHKFASDAYWLIVAHAYDITAWLLGAAAVFGVLPTVNHEFMS